MPLSSSNPLAARAVSDARLIVTDPQIAQSAPASLRRIAWLVLASQRGTLIPQRRRHEPGPGGVA